MYNYVLKIVGSTAIHTVFKFCNVKWPQMFWFYVLNDIAQFQWENLFYKMLSKTIEFEVGEMFKFTKENDNACNSFVKHKRHILNTLYFVQHF